MKVEFLTTDSHPEPHVLELTLQLFATAAADMGIAVEELGLVIVADDDHYGEAVERIQPGGGFTDHEAGRGVAKTHTVVTNGLLTSSIVINLAALVTALRAIVSDPNRKTDPAIEQLCIYLVYHELGHIVDNRRRPDQESPPRSLPGRGFEISQVTRYHAAILESEYAATAFSAPWMSRDAYLNSLTALAETLAVSRTAMETVMQRYSSGDASLVKLASTVACACSFVLIQFAKTAAMRIGEERLAAEAASVWPETNDALMIQLLVEFEASLAEHWDIYPDWPREPVPFLGDTWFAFASLEGFRFVENDYGSAVYW